MSMTPHQVLDIHHDRAKGWVRCDPANVIRLAELADIRAQLTVFTGVTYKPLGS